MRSIEDAGPKVKCGPVDIPVASLYKLGGEKPRKCKCGVHTKLITVEHTPPVAARLPFIVGIELHAKTLPSAKYIII